MNLENRQLGEKIARPERVRLLVGSREFRLGVFSLVLAFQVALPLKYYLGSGDPDDERFAWRMFSSTWLARRSCDVSYEDEYDQRPTIDHRAEQRFDAVWMPILKRRWDWATARVVTHRCSTRSGLNRVRIIERCGHSVVPVTYPCVGDE